MPAQEIQANLDAEQALLGSMLLDAGVADSVIARITEDAFYSEPHRMVFKAIQAACAAGAAAGWICKLEHGGIRYGRVAKPGPELHGFSIDVVDMADVVGPHHSHPKGEIDLIMPLGGAAEFDGHGAGWLVYGPGSAHKPTVTGGRAYVLYLLPEGAIAFTRA